MHDPVFRIGLLPIHPFGLMAAVGIVLGYLMALWRVARAGLPPRYLPGLLLVVGLGALIAARLGFMAQRERFAHAGLQGALSFWRGGLNLPAGVFGGILLLLLYTWARREPFWRWADALAPSASLALAVGMLGLPGSGEGWGEPTASTAIFMRVPSAALPQALLDRANHARFHPIWGYEAVLFALLALLLLVITARQRRAGSPAPGTVGLTFLFVAMLGYGALRPLTLDAATPALMWQTQLFCAALAAVSLGLLALRLIRAHAAAEVTREIKRVRVPSYR